MYLLKNNINFDNPYILVISALVIILLIIAIIKNYNIDWKNKKIISSKKINVKEIFNISRKIHNLDNNFVYECMEYLEIETDILYDKLLDIRLRLETEGLDKDDVFKIKNIYMLIYNIHKNRMLNIFRKKIIKKFKIDDDWNQYKEKIYEYTIILVKSELKKIVNEILSGELIKYNIIIVHKENHEYYKKQLFKWLEEFKRIYKINLSKKNELYKKIDKMEK